MGNYPFYESSLSIYTSAKKSIIDENSAATSYLFDAANTYEKIDEQIESGSNVFNEIECRLTSLIDPKTGKDFGDQFRKIIFDSYDHNKWLGQYYRINNEYWLATNTNTRVGASASSILRYCNNRLKWYDENEILHDVPCVFSREIGSENMKDGSAGVPQIWGTVKIQIQRNNETEKIKLNQRFIFDGFAFQLQQINNHISSTYMELYMFETQTLETDDLINNIANGESKTPISGTQIKILPSITSIYLNETQVFMVSKYVNGIANQDTFNVTCEGVNQDNYELNIIDGNSFSIKNLIPSDNMLKIICTDITSSESVSIAIKLTKSW